MPRLAAVVLVLVASSSTEAAAATPPPFAIVGPNVPVSSDALLGGHPQQVEPAIAIDPVEPGKLLASAQEGRLPSGASRADGVYASSDGGASWTRGLVGGLTTASGGRFRRATDPMVAFGADGTAFYSSLVLDVSSRGPTSTAVLLNRSSDAGRTWSAPVTIASGGAAAPLDEPWLAVDAGAVSARRGAVYIVFNQADLMVMPATTALRVARSDDGGATWSKPVVASGGAHYVEGSRLVVGPDGTVHVFYLRDVLTSLRQEIRVARSSDGGATWSRPVTIATRRSATIDGLRIGPGIAAAADASTGALHAAWMDRREDAGDVAASRSSDGGRSWSRPLRLGNARRGEVQFTPAIAAAAGAAHLLFYDRAPDGRYNVFYAQSLDGGASFRSPLRVNARPFGVRHAARSTTGRFLGDYIGLAATESFAQAVWVDSRRSSGNDVFTARVAPAQAAISGASARSVRSSHGAARSSANSVRASRSSGAASAGRPRSTSSEP